MGRWLEHSVTTDSIQRIHWGMASRSLHTSHTCSTGAWISVVTLCSSHRPMVFRRNDDQATEALVARATSRPRMAAAARRPLMVAPSMESM